MIFQISIELELPNKDVHAVIDFDTGLTGFNEILEGKEIEYTYLSAPIDYRVALLTKLEPMSATSRRFNSLIRRKNE